MEAKSTFLQIRITPSEKRRLQTAARNAGLDVSAYVLSRALSPVGDKFLEIVKALGSTADEKLGLAELNDLLAKASGTIIANLPRANFEELSSEVANYLAAMIEHAAFRGNVSAPLWTREIERVSVPQFGSDIRALRAHLLRSVPLAFKARNIFIDATIGDRI